MELIPKIFISIFLIAKCFLLQLFMNARLTGRTGKYLVENDKHESIIEGLQMNFIFKAPLISSHKSDSLVKTAS